MNTVECGGVNTVECGGVNTVGWGGVSEYSTQVSDMLKASSDTFDSMA